MGYMYHANRPILPLSTTHSSYKEKGTEVPSIRASVRRVAHLFKTRLGRFALPLLFGSLFILLYLFSTWSSDQALSLESPITVSKARPSLRGRTRQQKQQQLELQEKWRGDEAEYHSTSVRDGLSDDSRAMRALVWWIAEGGTIPHGWPVPNKEQLLGDNGRNTEMIFGELGGGTADHPSLFPRGWEEQAATRTRLMVFSKTYCPYSKRAKSTIAKYDLTPGPFIVELDQRPDTQSIQNLLLLLTGRRTVPNVILDYRSLGGSDEIVSMDGRGELDRLFLDAGLLNGPTNVDGAATEDQLQPIAAEQDAQERQAERKNGAAARNGKHTEPQKGGSLNVFDKDDEYALFGEDEYNW